MLLLDPDSKRYFLKAGDAWVSAADVTGPWTDAAVAPASVAAAAAQLTAANKPQDGAPQENEFVPPNWILTKDNIPSPTDYFPVVPDYLAQFKALWGK